MRAGSAFCCAVPAFAHIRAARLGGIDDDSALFRSQQIHARARGKILRRLGAAMQHDDDGQGFGAGSIRQKQHVVAATLGPTVAMPGEPGIS
jgi:hypothetical protein